MIEIDTETVKDRAEMFYGRFKSGINSRGGISNSIKYGRGAREGYYGEIAVLDHLNAGGDRYAHVGARHFDLQDIVTGLTIDVKSVLCTSPPKMNYMASVEETSYDSQDCDVLYFVRVLKDFSKLWLMGYILKDDFKSKADYFPKNSFEGAHFVRKSCYKLAYAELVSPHNTGFLGEVR